MSLGINLLTRGRITTSDARSMATHGFTDNTPAPPVASPDYCPVPIRVAGSTSTIKNVSRGTTIKIGTSTTTIKKRC